MLDLTEKHSNWERRFMLWMAAFTIFSVFAYCFSVTFFPFPTGRSDTVNFILGTFLGAGFTGIVTFFYGSSKSSRDKDDAMNKMALNATPTAQADINNDSKIVENGTETG